VQVLFGFLLTVPFQQRFGEATSFQRGVYFVTLVSAAAATALLIAPSAYHRMVFRMGEKPQLIKLGNSQLMAGLGALAVAMNGAVLLVTDFLFSAPLVIVVMVVLITLFFTLWFGLGLYRRWRLERDAEA
jgi:Flp pilus assembly protein TadB